MTLPPHPDRLCRPARRPAWPGASDLSIRFALLMVEAGKARLISVEPGESGAICTFETVAGDVFSLPKPPLSEADEAAMRARLREILGEDRDD